MRPLHARVLLDTGPSDEESAYVGALFRSLGMTARVEGHSYGGPPPTSAFLIVINVPLVAFLDSFVTRSVNDRTGLEDLVRALLRLRADPARWGRAHDLKLEDAHSDLAVCCPAGTPTSAFADLLQLELKRFDWASPPVTVLWNTSTRRWHGRIDTGAHPVLRRLPTRRRSGGSPGVNQLTPEEIGELWRLTERGADSVVRWQRAQVALLSALGWSVVAVSGKTLLTERRVAELVDNFNQDGLASLEPDYDGGVAAAVTPDEEREAKRIAAACPTQFGLSLPAWDQRSLADFLVGQGIVEDVSPTWLTAVAAHGRLTAAGSPAGRL